ncbi:hypothetical protein V5T82_14035 [Magnetovibrio sp. PR-2]|uniref:hypothetical protein n=1 Tax=Magnetovibrio sp. PR-2 TaxID=3120356 RepID=UPI002FCE14F9
MLFNLLATFFVGASVWILIWAGFRTFKRKAPGVLIPFAVGMSMLGYTIWNEYSWFERTMGAMPPEVQLVKTYTESRAWAPWTYIVPRTNRFVAVDLGKARTNPKFPDMVLVETLLVKRDEGPAKVQQMMHCGLGQFADLPANPEFGVDGLPVGVRWTPAGDFPELMDAVCQNR